jgi:hydroxyacylglutathione hydrolase
LARKTETRRAALAYFEAMNARDVDAAVACYAQGAEEVLHGQRTMVAPDGVRSFAEELLGAIPDLRFEIHDATTDGDRCAVRYTVHGTFAGPGSWNGVAPTGARLEIPGCDVFVVANDLIMRNDGYVDAMTVARQMGALPPADSPAEQRMTSLVNARTRFADRLLGTDFGQIAEGVWRLQGNPARCNVYFVRDGDGVLMFDAGARTMVNAVAAATARLGGLTRIVLGHGHTDHRGTAPSFDVPIACHADEVVDAEGSGGFRYWGELDDLGWRRPIHRWLHRRFWDGGPVRIDSTLAEGDEVAGFRVVHLPGHAPGLIALYRENDRLALTSDCFYTLDQWGRDCDPHLPMEVYNLDTEQARASIRKLAALEPAACWPGHANAVAGADVRARLERAAAG